MKIDTKPIQTEKKCPIGFDKRTTCRDCQFNKGGCNYPEFEKQMLNAQTVENIEDYWLHLAEGAH